MLYSIDPSLTVTSLLAYLFSGMAIGAAIGFVASLLMTSYRAKIPRSAFLGALGFLTGELGTLYLPGSKSTVFNVINGQLVASTVSNYSPQRIAIALAIILPVAYQLLRLQVAPRTSSAGRSE